ncbi:hypothetical protein CR513_20644, partial [Mucuna pruriens]
MFGRSYGAHPTSVKIDEGQILILKGSVWTNKRRFVRDFSTIVASLNEIIKKELRPLRKSLLDLQGKASKFSNASTPKFSLIFQHECNASNVGVGEILLQEGHLISFFNEKLKGASCSSQGVLGLETLLVD